jgi:RNA polymerase sigma factor (sigma-70 family)
MSFLRSRAELLTQFRAGERGALAEVYREYLPRLRQLIRRGFVARQGAGVRIPGASSPDELADVLQEVFTRAFSREARLAYDGTRDYWPYLAVIARNTVVSRHRRQGREVLGLEATDSLEDLIMAPDEPSPWHDAQSLAIVQAYVSSLEEPLRAVHAARYVDALSQRDAAEKLGLSRPKVRKVEAKLRLGLLSLLVQAGLHGGMRSADTVDEQDEWIARPRMN